MEKEVKMIRHEGPCQASGVEAFQIPQYPPAQVLPVILVRENVPLFDASCINVMERTGKIDSWSPWHTNWCSKKHAMGKAWGRGEFGRIKKLKNVPKFLFVLALGSPSSPFFPGRYLGPSDSGGGGYLPQ